ncbi:unnamed protein product [Schistosoma mattheei]|uniref:Uncharacterized protein n=1 Tax=Schistosoma mattheei TaxID=31246 RepID=A0A183NJR9_9TREM|nr:unnamed protein product [Schistosoma mattheei]
MLNVSHGVSPKYKRITETVAGQHNDQDPSQGTGLKRPENPDSSVGTTKSLVPNQTSTISHASGLTDSQEYWEQIPISQVSTIELR